LSICRKDLDGRFTFANRRFLELSDITLESLLGKTDYDLHPPELAEKYRRDDQAIVESGKVWELIEERTLLGSETIVVQSIKTPIYDGTGKVNGIQISFWDITERKQAEELMHKARWRLESIIEGTQAGTWEWNVQTGETIFNDIWAQIIGYTLDELAPINIKTWEKFVHPDDLGESNNLLNRHFAGELPKYDFECRMRHKDGHWVWVHDRGSVVTHTPEGLPLMMFGTHIDITERKRSEESLEQKNHDLEQAILREQKLSTTDHLTGINNRRQLFELAEREFAVAARYEQPLAVILFDIDYFKKVNDLFGHDIGDEVLVRITQIACAELRSADVIGRYGGEEFIILLPMTNSQQAYLLAERIRVGVESLRVPPENGDLSITLSIGIVEMSPASPPKSVEDLFRRADKAMYSAKHTGRNRTVII